MKGSGNTLFTGIFGIFASIFCIICAALDFDWFMNSNKAKIFVELFGRDGARIFYILLGLFLLVVSIFLVI